MKLRDLHLEGFGVLTGLRIDDLGEGLTVLHGPNGAGKTTVLQFLRGLFVGYGEARRLRLLPPLKGGTPGGSAVVTTGPQGRFTVVRHSRADASDTLAINVRQGSPDEARRLRGMVEGLNADLIRNLYAFGNLESHNLALLVQLAQRDGIDFESRRTEASWLRGQIETVRQDRRDLFDTAPVRGPVADLEKERDLLRNRIESHRGEGRSRHEDHAVRLRHLLDQRTRLAAEVDWLDLELQSIQSQLTECHDRLWSRSFRTVREARFVQPEPVAAPAAPLSEIDELDRQIEHCRQVLRDLAASRHSLSLESASLAGAETPDEPVTFDRERSALRILEGHLHRLDGITEEILEAIAKGDCLCDSTQQTLSSSSSTMREQVYLLCQELNRRQKEAQRRSLLARRRGVDRIELELEDRIRGLRWKRDSLLATQRDSDRLRIVHRADLEADGCECDDHTAWTRKNAPQATQPAPVETFIERTIEESNARPGDADLALQLAARKSQLWTQLKSARERKAELERTIEAVRRRETEFAQDKELQTLQYDYAVIEQRLADAREQWQSLALLQATLLHARKNLEQETHPQVIVDASATFRRLTQGRYAGFRYNTATRELCVEPPSGELQTIPSLSRGTLDQAALSLRLALADEYARRGFRFPLVLDDVLVDTDEGRLRIAAEVLRDAADRGHQILFLTCQDHLAELFHQMGVTVRGLNHTWKTEPRGPRPESTAPLGTARLIAPPIPTSTSTQSSAASESASLAVVEEPVVRTQPDSPYWLQPDSPVSLIPSLGSQMGRRLGAIGVATVVDLIDLDPESAEIPLSGLQVSAAQLRTWQAEGRLLCCIPDLNGRDAQLLVACGILSPFELAEADGGALADRIARVRVLNPAGTFDWLSDRMFAPDPSDIQQWITQSKRARTLAQALGEIGWSEDTADSEEAFDESASDGEELDPEDPDPAPNSAPGTRTLVRRARRSGSRRPNRFRPRGGNGSGLRLRSSAGGTNGAASPSDPVGLRFFLHPESPVVDAPSIGPKMAERLRDLGVLTVSDLLGRPAGSIAASLNDSKWPEKLIADWQRQASLMCRIPELRGHDAQVLVACGVDSVERLASMAPNALWEIVGPFVKTKEAARLLRSSTPPDVAEVTDWIRWASHSRSLRDAA